MGQGLPAPARWSLYVARPLFLSPPGPLTPLLPELSSSYVDTSGVNVDLDAGALSQYADRFENFYISLKLCLKLTVCFSGCVSHFSQVSSGARGLVLEDSSSDMSTEGEIAILDSVIKFTEGL